ncbi:MAG: hypothetical protein IPH91_06740 [Elusimicrobia bacterium]|nr:hypothetical protein [Elusimicrobiota bacterium]MBK7688391.1 hypothetical protein [Elusimicrobiota bacterium]MBK8423207.1 hypothetical protein [Elusimicrobiota bacterium]
MKTSIPKLLSEVEDLLSKCGQKEHASWIHEKKAAVIKDKSDSKKLKTHYKEIKNILGGMGSLSDLVLTPNKGVGLTPAIAEQKKRCLVDELWNVL